MGRERAVQKWRTDNLRKVYRIAQSAVKSVDEPSEGFYVEGVIFFDNALPMW